MFTYGHGESGFGDNANPLSTPERDSRRIGKSYGCIDPGAMGDVRIIAGVLDHPTAGIVIT